MPKAAVAVVKFTFAELYLLHAAFSRSLDPEIGRLPDFDAWMESEASAESGESVWERLLTMARRMSAAGESGRDLARIHMQDAITRMHRRAQIAEGTAIFMVNRSNVVLAPGLRCFVSGLVPRGECHIDRTYSGCNGLAVLVRDSDDEIVHRFPATWTDEQIWHALEFANAAYRSGFHRGEASKVNEARAVLGLPAKG